MTVVEVVVVLGAIFAVTASRTYDQFLPRAPNPEFYDGFSGSEQFVTRITTEIQFTWEGEQVKVNTGHWRCWTDILRDLPFAYDLQTTSDEDDVPLSARAGSARAHVASERLAFMLNMHRSGYPLSSACCHPQVFGDAGNPSCWIHGHTSHSLCCGVPVLPKRCPANFGPAFVLDYDDNGHIDSGTWKEWEANPYDCASLDEISLYFQTGVVGGSDKDSGVHDYLNFYEKFLQKFGVSARVLEMGIYKGNSLALWSLWFPDGDILGVDKTEEHARMDPALLARGANITGNIEIRVADCTSQNFAGNILDGRVFDVMIDDASHKGEQQVATFEQLFASDHLFFGGVYIVEDVTDPLALHYFNNLVGISHHFGTGFYQKIHLMDVSEFAEELQNDWRFLVKSVSFQGELVVIEKREMPLAHLTSLEMR